MTECAQSIKDGKSGDQNQSFCIIKGTVPIGPQPIAGVSTSVAAFVGISEMGPISRAMPISSFANYKAHFGELDSQFEMGFAVYQFFLNGGTTCWVVRAGTILNQQCVEIAFVALDEAPILNLLCLPGVSDKSILGVASVYAEKRRAFLIIDSDANARTPEQLMNSMQGALLPRTASAAIYGPWLQIADPLNGNALRTVAPSGSVAGVYACIDGTAGVWKAPAGISATILGAKALAEAISDSDSEALNALGFNSLRNLPGDRIVIWGARTLAGSGDPEPSYKYISIRRFALFLEESINRGTQWAVFEPNSEPLWKKIEISASAFLQSLFTQGALQGSTPSQAYFVKCDSSTTTQSDIDMGILNITVGFAPLKPAEFVIVQIQQLLGKPQPAG